MNLIPSRNLRTLVIVCLCVIGIGFPVASSWVFLLDGDRRLAANIMALSYLIGFYGMFLSPWLKVGDLRDWSTWRRLRATVTIWLWTVYLTAVIWELPWLLFHETIRAAKDELWAYSWWAYIDGGDIRYAGWDPTIATLEWFTVINALIGLPVLIHWVRNGRKPGWPLFVFMFTGASHFYQTMQYYVSQALQDFAHVGDTAFDLYVRFFMVNSPWVLLPLCVWCYAWWELSPDAPERES
ncbi:MAG: hypothetical protein D6761_03740 [Candidatus Dadabacteria bacterium]|nr:MAG: hypothetical protein D6761_03740 [Candidatus Dadabacteria bacterium]